MVKFLHTTFVILQFIGLWQPSDWKPGWKTRLYPLYIIFVFTIMMMDTVGQIIDVFQTTQSVSDFANTSFILLTEIGIVVKMAILIINRNDIIGLVDSFTSGYFKPRSEEEAEIVRKFETKMK